MRKSKKFIPVVIVIVIIAIIIGIIGVKKAKASAAKAEELAKISAELEEGDLHIVAGLHGSENTIVKEGDKYVESGAFAIDDRTGPLTDCEISGKVDTDKPGDYKVKYTFTADGARNTVERKVKVVAKKDFKENKNGIPVLMYHYVYNESQPPETLNSNYIKDTDIEEQLEYLKENDYYFPSFAELRAYIDEEISLPAKSVILTFDDGQYGFLENGIKVLDKCKVPATSFVIGTKEGEYKVKTYRSPYVSYESHSYDMHKPGGNIGHGGVISAMTKDEIVEDLKKEAAQVGSNNAFAYPFGDVTDDALAAIKEAKILCAFTTVYGIVQPGDDFTQLPRVRVMGQNSLDSYIASLS